MLRFEYIYFWHSMLPMLRSRHICVGNTFSLSLLLKMGQSRLIHTRRQMYLMRVVQDLQIIRKSYKAKIVQPLSFRIVKLIQKFINCIGTSLEK